LGNQQVTKLRLGSSETAREPGKGFILKIQSSLILYLPWLLSAFGARVG
jgi:hypothetical protein